MNIKRFLAAQCMFSALFLTSVSATAQTDWFQNNYILAAPQYSDVRVQDNDDDTPGFTLALGTQIHEKWYAEIGYSVLATDFDLAELDLNNSALQVGDSAGVDASGFYAALLGKATGDTGELFYKLGVMILDYESAWIGSPVEACAVNVPDVEVCRFRVDESSVAGMVGAGFDFFVGYNAQVRLSAEHIRTKDNIQINTLHLGLRYNF